MTIQDQITTAANSVGVPAWLALAIAQQESGFNQNAVGSAGEIGIFQLLPSTAAMLGVDPTDPTQNIAGGVAYLAQLLRTFGGDTQKAAAAYNCGPTCVANAVAVAGANWATRIPYSTQSYVASVTGSLPSSISPAPPSATAAAAQPTAAVPSVSAAGVSSSSVFGTQLEPFALGVGALLGIVLLRSIAQRV